MPDHFGSQFGPWAALSAAASVTSSLRVGTLVACNDFRHPLVLAREARPVPAQRPHPPLMIGAAGARMLGLAAREADIVTLCPRTRPDGSGLILSSVSAQDTRRKIGWVQEAAGDRFGQLELGALVFAVEVTGDRMPAAEALAARWDLTPQEVLSSPHLLVGTPEEIAGDLLGYRERFGITYWVTQDMQPFAQVISHLAGT